MKAQFCKNLYAFAWLILLGVSLQSQAQVLLQAPSNSVLDQNCVVNILNRTVQVAADGSWSMPNVPSQLGRVRARATCVKLGETFSGQSDYFDIVQNGVAQVPPIQFDFIEPVPVSLQVTDPGKETLTHIGDTAQLAVNATYPDNTVINVTAAANGVNYTSSNPAIATVDADGLVTSVSSGKVLITARKDEVTGFIEISIATNSDSDNDGMPDDYELANGFNAHDPLDAQEDIDNDGLTNLQEYKIGTNPRIADSDNDGISDGDEVNGKLGYKTNPLNADSDGDGVNDLEEIKSGYNPIDGSDGGGRAFYELLVTPASPAMTFNTIYNEDNLQLKVQGKRPDGSLVDLTTRADGTNYSSSNLSVVSFGVNDGLLFAGQAGSADITVSNKGLKKTVTVNVGTFDPKALSSINIPGYANNVDVAGDYAYVAAGSKGLQIVDVSNRANPVIVGSFDTTGTSIDVRVVGNVVYLADGEQGLQIIDVSDPRNPALLSSFATAGIAQDVLIDNQYAYIAVGDSGLVIVDVHNPAQPVAAGVLSGFGTAKGVSAQDNKAVIVAGSYLYVIDVTDKLNPVKLGSLGIGPVKDVVMKDNYAYVSAYSSGWKVVDISDSNNPVAVAGDAQFVPRDMELTDGFAFAAEQVFPNVNTYVNIQDPAKAVFQGTINLEPLGDYAGTGIALDSNYVYTTEESFVVTQDYGSDGNTRLFIAQYRLTEDKGGIPPTIELVQPVQDSVVVEGKKVTVSANADDDIGVKAVSFIIDGKVVYTDTSRPYQYPLSIPYGTVGNTITISAKASDFGGNTQSTQTINLFVEFDNDRDGLSNQQEQNIYHTDATNPDSDGDSLQDGDEVDRGTDPNKADTDGDGIADGAEVQNGTDPLNPDVTPPAVSLTVPNNLDTKIAENNPITITFSEALSAKSVKSGAITVYEGLLAGAAIIPGNIRLSSDGMQVIFTPTNILGHNTDYKVVVDHVRDAAGNPLTAPFSFQYKTGYTVDNTPPTVLSTDPSANSSNVPVNAQLNVVFSKPIDANTLNDQDVQVYDDVSNVLETGSVSLSGNGQVLTFVPNKALTVGRRHHLVLTNAIKDLFGNALPTSYYYFTTTFNSDSVSPNIIDFSIGDGQTAVPLNPQLQIKYDEIISDTALVNVKLLQNGQEVTSVRQLSADHQTLTLKLLQPLLANTAYTIHVEGVQDLSGNVQTKIFDRHFTTGTSSDTVIPVLVNYSPNNGAGNVGTNAQVTATFNERINPLSVANNSFYIYDNVLGKAIAATATYSADGITITLTPTVPLEANRSFTVYGSYSWQGAYITDLAGNQLNGVNWSFSTGNSASLETPVITGSNIQDGATGLATNAALRFVLDESVRSSSVNGSVVLQDSVGNTITGVISLGADNQIITFTPTTPLAVNTSYSVVIAGLTDYSGHQLASITKHFTTGNAVDKNPPTFNVTPGWNYNSVSVTTPISIVFNKTIDASSLSGIHVTANGFNGNLAGTLAMAADGKTVTFTPMEPLPANTQINVYVSGVLDLAGNANSGSWSYFTTGSGGDTTPPRLMAMTPADSSLDVGLNNPIVLTFSESLNQATVNQNSIALFANGNVIHPNISYSADNRTITLTHSLPAASVISVIMTNDVQDLRGNRLADTVKIFTTAGGVDTTRPSIVSAFPGSGSYNVPLKNKIVLYSNKPLNSSSLQSAFHVSQNGQLVKGTLQVIGDGSAVEFTPAQAWAYASLIEVFVESTALDNNGDALNSFSGSFRTVEDPTTVAPYVVALNTSNGINIPLNGVVDLQFNEALDPATVNSSTLVLHDGYYGTQVPVTVSLRKGNRVVRLAPTQSLTAGHGYYIGIRNGLTDAGGTASKQVYDYNWYFTTGQNEDQQIPHVLALSLGQHFTNVAINSKVDMRFDEAINPISMLGDEADTPLTQVGNNVDDRLYSFSFSQGNTQVSYTPNEPWPVNSDVTVNVVTPENYAGQPVQSLSQTFHTGNSPDVSALAVESWNFVANSNNVPVNAALIVRLNKTLDTLSVTSGSVYLYDTLNNQRVNAAVSLAADNRTITLVSNQALAVGRQYYLQLNGVLDLSGNSVGTQTQYFRTTFQSDTLAPSILGYNINADQTGLPTNIQLQVKFDEALDVMKLNGIRLMQNGVTVATTAQLNADRTLLTLLPSQLLQANTAYILHVEGVSDLSGMLLAQADERGFTTGMGADLVNASLQTYSPAANIGNVALDAQIVLSFNEIINPFAVSSDSVTLYDAVSGQHLPTQVNYSADKKTLTLTPVTPLSANRQYYVYISNWATLYDIAGNRVNWTYWTFYTGNIAHSSSPLLSSMNIPDGASDVLTNATLRMVLNEPIRSTSVAGSVVVQDNQGVTISGTVSLGSDNQTLTFTPATPLAANTRYSVIISGLLDYAGHSLASVTNHFSTGAAADKNPPSFNVTPGWNYSNVSVNSSISIVFNKIIDPSSLGGIHLTANGFSGNLAGTLSLGADSKTVTFTPLAPLPTNTQINVYVSGVLDLAGNANSGSWSYFTTGVANGDMTPPKLLSMTPNDGAADVSGNSPIVLTFSESLNQATVNSNSIGLFANGNLIRPTISYSADNRTITLSSSLPTASVVSLILSSDIQDLSGNHLLDTVKAFTTAVAAPDNNRPSIVTAYPGSGAFNVPLKNKIILYSNKPLDNNSLQGALHISQNGQLVKGTLQQLGDGRTLEFTPVSDWSNSALIEITLDSTAMDSNGDALNSFSTSFRTVEDSAAVAPYVLALNTNNSVPVPLNGVLDLQFNEALDPATVNSTTLVLHDGYYGTQIPVTVSLSKGNRVVRLTPNQLLQAGHGYYIGIRSGLTDATGTASKQIYDYNWYFTTSQNEDSLAPHILLLSPGQNATGVGINGKIDMRFDEAINPISLLADDAGLPLTQVGNNTDERLYSYSFSNGNTQVSYTPNEPWPVNSDVTISVSLPEDYAGHVVESLSHTFHTGNGPDLSGLAVESWSYSASALNVPINAGFSLRMNKAVDQVSVTTGSVYLRDTTNYQIIAADVSLGSDGRTITLTPSKALALSHQYYLQLNGVLDISGNSAGTPYQYFTTSATADTLTPQIIGYNFSDGLTGVPTNPQLQVQFNEALNALNLDGVHLYHNGVPVAATPGLSGDHKTLNLNIAQLLQPNTTYTLHIEGVADLSGNVLAKADERGFTTSSNADLVNPGVISYSPAQNAGNVALDAQIVVSFNEIINPFTLSTDTLALYDTVTGQRLATTASYSADGKTITLTPAIALTANRQYYVYISNWASLYDLAGNRANWTYWSFTTGAVLKSVAPVISVSNIQDGEAGIPTNSALRFVLDQAVRSSTVSGSVSLQDGLGNVITGSAVLGSDNRTVTFTPAAPLAANTAYSVVVSGLQDYAGRSLAAVTEHFNTGAGADSSKPTFNVFPGWNYTNVNVNAPIDIVFNKTVDPSSLSGIYVTANGVNGNLPGSVALASDGKTVIFSPLAALPANTQITIYVNGVLDLAGNASPNGSSYFTTAGANAPLSFNVNPGWNYNNVSVNTPINIVFNKAVNPNSLTGIHLTANGFNGNLAGSVSLGADGKTVTFTPLSALPGNTQINVYVSGVLDLAGNANTSASSYFTTSSNVDTTAPKLLTITPADSAVDIGLNNPIVLNFSESLNQATVSRNTIALFANGNLLQPNISYSADNRTITLSNTLPPSSVISVILSKDIQDLNGNPLADSVHVFTTSAATDTSRPSVVTAYPGSGAYNVPVKNKIVLYSNKPLDSSSVTNAFHATQNGQAVKGTLQVIGDGSTLEFTPAQDWAYAAQIAVTLDSTAVDLNGDALNSFSNSFRIVEDPAAVAPYVLALNTNNGVSIPLNGVLELLFNEALELASVNSTTLVLRDGYNGPLVPMTVSLHKGGRVVRLTPDQALQAGHGYYIGIRNGLTDASGTASKQINDYNWYFTVAQTADTMIPHVLALSPGQNYTQVGINSKVDIRFDEAINPFSMLGDDTSLPLTQVSNNTDQRLSSLNFSNGYTQASYVPNEPWPVNSDVTVTIATAEDYAGNGVQSLSHTFHTGNGPDVSSLAVETWSYAANASNVPVNAVFKLRLNKVVDPVSITSSSVYLHDTLTNQTVSASVSLGNDNRSLTLVPDQALAVGRQYYLQLNNVLDLAGNSVGSPYQYFRTAYQSETQAPQVVAWNVTADQTGLPTNLQLQVQFDAALDALQLKGVQLLQNANAVNTTLQLNADHTQLTLLLSEPLKANTSYTLHIEGVADLSGNVLAPAVERSFTTGGGADLINASLTSYSPAQNVSNVALDAQIVLSFNEMINPLAVTSDSLTLYDTLTGQHLATTIGYSTDGKTLTLVPKIPLSSNRQYTVYVSNWVALYDLAGNRVNWNSWSFSTGNELQSVNPLISGMNIQEGETGVLTNAALRFVLDEPVRGDSINGSVVLQDSSGNSVSGSIVLGSDNRTISFKPSALLSANTAYKVVISGLTDYAGYSLSPVTQHFTTGSGADSNQPTFNVNPGWNYSNVSVSTPITIVFNKIIDPSSLDGIHVTANGFNGNLAGSAKLAGDGKTVTFTPASPLPANTQINVYVSGVLDLAGNANSGNWSYFTTGNAMNTALPKLLSMTPADSSTDVSVNNPIVLTFSESLNQSTVNRNTVALFANGNWIQPNISYSSDNRTVILNSSLPAASVISVVLTSDIQDLNGNHLPDSALAFTTAVANDTSRPSVVTAYPGNGAYNVPVQNKIVLYSNKPLNAASVQGAFHASQNGRLVKGSLQLIGDGSTLEFTPAQAWANSALIEVTLDSSVTDNNGDALNSFSSSFRTVEDPAAVAPYVVALSTNTGVITPLNAVLDLQFNEALDPANVNSATLVLRDGYNGTQIPVSVTLRKGNRVARLAPNQLLQAGHGYYIGIRSGLTDASGTASTQINDYNWYFTAGQTADATTPHLVTLSPGQNFANVAINSKVDMRFDEAINPISLLSDDAGIALTQVGNNIDERLSSFSISNGNTQVSYVPNEPWPVNSDVTLTVTAAEDYAGHVVQSLSHTFHTSNGPDVSGLSVESWSFPANAGNVPVNAMFNVRLNKIVDVVSVTSSSVYVYDTINNQAISATISLGTDNRTISLVPNQPLAVGRQYYFQLNNVLDLSGNSVGSPYQYFKTAYQADTIAPQITSFNVAADQTGLPTNVQLQVKFSEPVSRLQLDGVQLLQNGKLVNATPQLSADYTVLTLLLSQPLRANTAYTLHVEGVADLSGNVLGQSVERVFTTGNSVDLLNAGLLSYSPAQNLGNVALDAQITLTFNEMINPFSVTSDSLTLYDTVSGQHLSTSVSYSSDNKTLTLIPAVPLSANRQYSVYISNWTSLYDLAGNRVNWTYWNFNTGSTVHSQNPLISSMNIADGSSGVLTNAALRFVINEPIRSSSVPGSVVLQDSDGNIISGSTTLSADNRTIIFTPSALLADNTRYSAVITGLIDYAGHSLAAVSNHFTTGASADRNQPTFNVTPGWNYSNVSVTTPISIVFNKSIDPSSLGGIYVTANGFSGNLAGSVSLEADGKTVSFTPVSPLPANDQINVYVNGVLDLAGNPNSGNWSYFNTGSGGDTTPPKLLSITPADSTADVSVSNPIVLTFSESLNQSTVNRNSVGLFANGNLIQPNISYSADNRTVTLSTSLPAGSAISVILTSDIQDLLGNHLADTVTAFTTAAAIDSSRPSIVTAYPGNGAFNVPVSNKIVLYSNKPLSSSTVRNALHVSQNGKLVAGQLKLIGDGSTLEFTPAQAWANSALVEVTLDSSAQDQHGDALNSFSTSFRIVEDPALVAPYVLALNTNNGVNMPLNGVLDLQFNEALDPVTVNSSTLVLRDGYNGAEVPLAVSLRKGNRVARLTPNQALTAGHGYYIGIRGGLADSSGTLSSQINDYNWYFTAGQSEDSLTPHILALSPGQNATAVGINSKVDMRFDEAIDPLSMLSDDASVPLAQVGNNTDERLYSLNFSNGYTQVSYIPNEPWPVNSDVTITVSTPEDNAGHGVQSLSHTFHTSNGPDLTALSVDNWSFPANAGNVPVNGAFNLHLNKPLDPVTVTSSSVYLVDTSNSQHVAASVSLGSDDETLTLVPNQALQVNHQYYLQLNNVQDLSGNNVGSPYQYFTTGTSADTVAPQISAYNFNAGQAGMPTNVQLQVKFDEALDALSLGKVHLYQNGSVIPTTAQLSGDHQTLTLILGQLLLGNTAYRVHIEGVSDLSGNILAQADDRNLTTGPRADLLNSSLTALSPAQNAVNVALSAQIVMSFNESINPFTLTGNSLTLYDNATGQHLAASAAFSADGTTVTLMPTLPFTANRQYTVYVSNWATLYDLAGNRVNWNYWSFTTGAN